MTLSPVKAGYTGHEHDAELGLVNMKGRIYDPFTRRFLTPDPYVTDPLNPQGLNRFSYVRNNPLNLVDPTGFSGEGGGCDNNCGGGPEGGIVIMPEIVITASAPTTYVNTNANVNQSSSGSFNANGFSASGFNISSLGEGTGNSSGSGNAAISDGRMTGGYYSPQMSGGDNRGGDVQAVANQNPSSNPQAGTEPGSTPQPTDNRTASPALEGGIQRPAAAVPGVIGVAGRYAGPALEDLVGAAVRQGLRVITAIGSFGLAATGLLATSDSSNDNDASDNLSTRAKGTPNVPQGYTDKVGKVAAELGRTVAEVQEAIHGVKSEGLGRGGPTRNPDVLVNPSTGDVRPQTPHGPGDSIGNIFDHLR